MAGSTEGWTVVLPRCARPKKSSHKTIISDEQNQEPPQTPRDHETDPEREAKLMLKMQTCIRKLENSEFWLTFLNQLQTPETSDRVANVLGGSEVKACMVIYGIGSIESYESPRLQLSLAILIKRKFGWIEEMEVFDPIISRTESKVLTALGCSVLSINEEGRRKAIKPTLFFMPHCEAELYNNLLQANWRADLLNRIVLFGNSFEVYKDQFLALKDPAFAESRKFILGARKFSKEVGIDCGDDYFEAFNSSSWHFFSLDSEVALTTFKS